MVNIMTDPEYDPLSGYKEDMYHILNNTSGKKLESLILIFDKYYFDKAQSEANNAILLKMGITFEQSQLEENKVVFETNVKNYIAEHFGNEFNDVKNIEDKISNDLSIFHEEMKKELDSPVDLSPITEELEEKYHELIYYGIIDPFVSWDKEAMAVAVLDEETWKVKGIVVKIVEDIPETGEIF